MTTFATVTPSAGSACSARCDPGRWTVAGIAHALTRGHVSAREVVETALDRVASHDPAIGAFAHVRAEEALAEARQSTMRRARGTARGHLDGVPIAVKDLGDRVAGVPATLGCRSLVTQPAQESSVLVQRLQAAGCIVIGTTNVPELGHRLVTDNDRQGPTSSPFAPGRLNAGGSSGGSAAAVAAGMVTAALGSDGAGSIRVPAALCGVVGLKPSFGLVPNPARPNGFRNGGLFVSAGPLTRTVGDARLLLDVLAGPHPDDPFSFAHPPASDAEPGPLRVGLTPDFGGFPVEPAVAAAVRLAGESLADAGHQVVQHDLRLPTTPDQLTALVRRAVGWTLADVVDGLVDQGVVPGNVRDVFTPSLLALVDEARATSTAGWRADGVVRTRLWDEVQRAFQHVDVLVGPVTAVCEVPNAAPGRTVGRDRVAGTPVDPLFGWSTTWAFNLTGHPAVSVPAGVAVGGGPLAVQIAGRRGADHAVLSAAAALERHLPWHHRYRELDPA